MSLSSQSIGQAKTTPLVPQPDSNRIDQIQKKAKEELVSWLKSIDPHGKYECLPMSPQKIVRMEA